MLLLPVTLWAAARLPPVPHAGAVAWLAAIYMALFPSVIAYLIYYYALARMTATRVSAFSYLQPHLRHHNGCRSFWAKAWAHR